MVSHLIDIVCNNELLFPLLSPRRKLVLYNLPTVKTWIHMQDFHPLSPWNHSPWWTFRLHMCSPEGLALLWGLPLSCSSVNWWSYCAHRLMTLNIAGRFNAKHLNTQSMFKFDLMNINMTSGPMCIHSEHLKATKFLIYFNHLQDWMNSNCIQMLSAR